MLTWKHTRRNLSDLAESYGTVETWTAWEDSGSIAAEVIVEARFIDESRGYWYIVTSDIYPDEHEYTTRAEAVEAGRDLKSVIAETLAAPR